METQVEVRKRKSTFYKQKYLTARGLVVMLTVALALTSAALAWVLKGNCALQRELAANYGITEVVR